MWLRVCSNDHAPLTVMPYIIFFLKVKNCLKDVLFISCDDRIGKMLHNNCISALALLLRWATHGPWASCFKTNFFQKNLSRIPSECQTVWIQIRPDILSGLIQVHTVCKGYQQRTKVAPRGNKPLNLLSRIVADVILNLCIRETKTCQAWFALKNT